jgi:hypothetical protein
MFGVTCFGLIFTPVFYIIVRNLGRKEQKGGLMALLLKNKLAR